MTDYSKNIFCAINTTDLGQATTMAAQVSEFVGGIMLGMECFTANGHKGIKQVLRACELPLYLDMKFHDIPSTVARAIKAIAPVAPQYITLHASGGKEMLKAALEAANDFQDALAVPVPKLIASTVLTSIDESTFSETDEGKLSDKVKRLADITKESGLAGVECAVSEAAELRKFLGDDMLIVVSGIRPHWSKEIIDQRRTASPFKAISAGADILIIGRPITESSDPSLAAKRIATELIDINLSEEDDADKG